MCASAEVLMGCVRSVLRRLEWFGIEWSLHLNCNHTPSPPPPLIHTLSAYNPSRVASPCASLLQNTSDQIVSAGLLFVALEGMLLSSFFFFLQCSFCSLSPVVKCVMQDEWDMYTGAFDFRHRCNVMKSSPCIKSSMLNEIDVAAARWFRLCRTIWGVSSVSHPLTHSCLHHSTFTYIVLLQWRCICSCGFSSLYVRHVANQLITSTVSITLKVPLMWKLSGFLPRPSRSLLLSPPTVGLP